MCDENSRLRKTFLSKRENPLMQVLNQANRIDTIQRTGITRGEGDKRYVKPLEWNNANENLQGQITDIISGTTPLDHGALLGLADDDHTQYVLRSILTTKGDIYGRSLSAVERVAVGSDGQVLTANSAASAGVNWQTPATVITDHGALSGLADDDHAQYVLRSIMTTKGDLFARSSSAVTRLGVGSNGQVLTADSAEATGIKWAAPATGAPVDATYLVLSANATLTNERRMVAGNGLTEADAGANSTYTLALGTPGTLSATSTSATTATSHTHAITSSSNPLATQSLLATNASGELYLRRLFVNSEEHINGRFTVGGASGTAMFVCDVTNDRVGVRVTNPTTQFHVSGNALITGNGNFGEGVTVGHDTNQAPPRVLTFRESSSRPATPAAGFFHLYIFSGALEMKDDAGVVTTY